MSFRSAAAKALFKCKARCNTCHGWVEAFPLLTDELYHNIGVGMKKVNSTGVAARAATAKIRPSEPGRRVAGSVG